MRRLKRKSAVLRVTLGVGESALKTTSLGMTYVGT